MKRALLTAAAASIAIATAGPSDASDCTARSGPVRARVVELYTSEGCNSCPPADRWLQTLAPADDLAVLAFHVDYWDYLGWRDRFGDPRFAQRQREMIGYTGGGGAYTPQVALDGRELKRWAQGLPPAQPASPVLNLSMRVETQAQALRVDLASEWTGPRGQTQPRAYFALTESGLESDVRSGENRGERLRHDHVVRAFDGPHPLVAATATLAVPADLARGRARVVVFVQDIATGAVMQAVQQPLATCGNDAVKPAASP
jgi:hypothetical protein